MRRRTVKRMITMARCTGVFLGGLAGWVVANHVPWYVAGLASVAWLLVLDGFRKYAGGRKATRKGGRTEAGTFDEADEALEPWGPGELGMVLMELQM